jgi:hypothetical protein
MSSSIHLKCIKVVSLKMTLLENQASENDKTFLAFLMAFFLNGTGIVY